MSKLTTRIIVSVLIGLALMFGVFMSVQAASANIASRSVGMYVLSGGLVNQLQPKPASEVQEFAPFYEGDKGDGRGGCESENNLDPNDL